MSRLGTLTRRTFLVGSAFVGGGVAFGIYLATKDKTNPLLADLPEGAAALTPYVLIDAEGVTLITPRADLGQGAYHVQALLLAEELDVDPLTVRVDPGPPAAAYYNSALAEEVVPFPVTDQGWVATAARTVAEGAMRIVAIQMTGGSSTVRDGYDRLRAAGASARETLKAAASQVSGVPVADLATSDGGVDLPDGTRLTYGELAPVAAGIAPVQDVPLRPASAFTRIGKPHRRFDILAKSTGTLTYGIDLAMEGMVHATVITSPRRGAMNSFDASAAEGMPGVKAIVPVTGGVGVVADNTWRAFQAARAITFDWGPSRYPAEQAHHWEALANSFTDDLLDHRNRDDGDITTAHAEGTVVTGDYRAPYLAHQPLEPLNATVRVAQDRVDVWCGTQAPGFVRAKLAEVTGLAAENIHIHVQYVGGSFGHQLEFAHIVAATEIAMTQGGAPVQLTLSREEDFAQDFVRQIAMARGSGTVADGQVRSLDLGIAMPTVIGSQAGRLGYALPGPDVTITVGAWDAPYGLADMRISGYRAPDLAPVSSWRSVGASTNVFFLESLLNELITEAGADPVQERLRLLTDAPSRRVVEAAAEMANWGEALPEGTGRGVAFGLSFGTPVAEIVEVTSTDAGLRVARVWVAAEMGRVLDPVNFENQVQGGVIWGLGHAMNCEITYADGMARQTNYHAHEGMRLYNAPEVFVRGLETIDRVRGIGEPPVPPAAPALAAAIYDAIGLRLREMPFHHQVRFV